MPSVLNEPHRKTKQRRQRRFRRGKVRRICWCCDHRRKLKTLIGCHGPANSYNPCERAEELILALVGCIPHGRARDYLGKRADILSQLFPDLPCLSKPALVLCHETGRVQSGRRFSLSSRCSWSRTKSSAGFRCGNSPADVLALLKGKKFFGGIRGC
jgi:hypothetical protein